MEEMGEGLGKKGKKYLCINYTGKERQYMITVTINKKSRFSTPIILNLYFSIRLQSFPGMAREPMMFSFYFLS